MLKLKGCPRCKKGDVMHDRDYYDCYEYCIQCGYLRDLESAVELGQQQACGVKEGRISVRTVVSKVASDG